MNWKAQLREMEAAERREQRQAQKRQRELAKLAKEQAKLSALEQARLEVETHENTLELLLSVHKEQGRSWNWTSIAASLPPPRPRRSSRHEIRAKQAVLVASLQRGYEPGSLIEDARSKDDEDYEQALREHNEATAEWEKMRDFAHRILSGEPRAYIEALADFSPLAEITSLGSSLHFTVHTPKLIECALKVNGTQAIPTQTKSLTAAGKVTTKNMLRSRFHEIYQDYVCGCMLRVARETFALLPVETLLITASADSLDSRTGQIVEQAVLSAMIPKEVTATLNFDHLDPSDAVESFFHRGDFRASRKTEAFQPITPLTPADLPKSSKKVSSDEHLQEAVDCLRQELRAMSDRLPKLVPAEA